MRLQPNWYVIVKTDEGDAFITDREGDFRVRCRPNARPSRMFEPYAKEIVDGLKILGLDARADHFEELTSDQFLGIKNEHVYYWDSMNS